MTSDFDKFGNQYTKLCFDFLTDQGDDFVIKIVDGPNGLRADDSRESVESRVSDWIHERIQELPGELTDYVNYGDAPLGGQAYDEFTPDACVLGMILHLAVNEIDEGRLASALIEHRDSLTTHRN